MDRNEVSGPRPLAAGKQRLHKRARRKLIQSGGYSLGRIEINQIMQIYATKMAGVFTISTSTISLQTRIFPRWTAFLGYALALLLSVGTIQWTPLVFPLWVLLISLHILIENLRRQPETAKGVGSAA
jgi:hypothetical protein